MLIKDLPITCPFKVYSLTRRCIIYRQPLDLDTMPDDMPDDIQTLPVVHLYTCNDTIYIDTEESVK